MANRSRYLQALFAAEIKYQMGGMDRNTIKRSCLPLSDNFCQRPCCALASHESFRAFRDLQRPTGRDQISSSRAHFTFECGLCTLPASVHSRKGQSESQRLLLAMPKM